MNEDFDPLEIYESNRDVIERELKLPGSKSRNVKGALSVSKFKSISSLVWDSVNNLDSK